METREILQDIIGGFSPDKFTRFFREKNRSFAPRQELLTHYNDECFTDGIKLGEIKFSESEKLIVCVFKASQPLSERSGKKAQYEKGKKILRDTQSDAGIFIFYDKDDNFRFSLIYPKVIGNRRQWSNFRRFTYFVSREFTNKTFKQRIDDCDFSSLEKIKDAFSVEKVTKEFYEDIANWYFWAVQHSTFPKDAEEEENGRNIAVIRLITRMIFIWFMREKSLVPKNLFEEKSISVMLKDISSESSTYYQAILQNLFFATLSTKKDDRKFRSEIRGYKGYNPDFGNQNVFRFQELFKNPENLKDDFGEVPFLNGGLFECLDDKPNGIYIDGFTAVKKNQSNVPNILFFSGEKKADLNAAYGTKSKTYKVRGLLDILSSFNFTIDENSPDDQDIALDPELLGRVFENLLASFNPETSTTARKATGSYYTPREIVDYMVTESLKAYFKTHLSTISDLDKKIVQLFSTGSEENPFDKSESKKIVELIESVRIVDPAVGSGAFPMGALNKLVFILNKVDPGNELWKQAQLSAADTIPDPRIKQDTKNRIDEFFKGKNADYGRKLYLIQKCIYGVDIQQIAVEIAKLRFFISLLVDEWIDKTKENWGIEPLPNLDFKIMQGNSLLEEYEGVKLFDEKLIASIDFDKQKLIESIKQKQSELQKEYLYLHAKNKLTTVKQAELNKELKKIDKQLKGLNKQDNKTDEAAGLFDAQNEAKQKKDILKRLHKDFFETNEKETKGKIKKQIEEIGWDLIEATLKEQNKTPELKKLEQFKKSNTKPFFLWKLHFADVFENGGFDIVIANPPYVQIKQIFWNDRKIYEQKFKSAVGRFNLFYFFLELTDNLTKKLGISAFIVPDRLLLNTQCDELRKWLLNEQTITEIDSFAEGVFEAVVDSIIIIYKNIQSCGKDINVKNQITLDTLNQDNVIKIPVSYFLNSPNNQFDLSYNPFTARLIEKTKSQSIELGKISEIKDGIIQGKVADKLFLSKPFDKDSKSLLFGKDISKYMIQFNNNWVNYKPSEMMRIEVKRRAEGIRYGLWMRTPAIFERNKILTRQTADEIIAAYDVDSYYYSNTLHGTTITDKNYDPLYVLSILNSRLITWYYRSTTAETGKVFAQVKIEILRQLPIKYLKNQKSFIEIVDKILAITKSGDYLENPAKKEEVIKYEKQIDQMVYKLYALTDEEIDIIKGNDK